MTDRILDRIWLVVLVLIGVGAFVALATTPTVLPVG